MAGVKATGGGIEIDNIHRRSGCVFTYRVCECPRIIRLNLRFGVREAPILCGFPAPI